MLLVDSSVWVLAERNRIVIADHIPEDEVAATCPIILQEVLRGVQSFRQYDLTRRVMLTTELLDAPTPLERFEQAARIYLACRAEGVTPRSSVDCLIVATAIAYNAAILHDDRDFEAIGRAVPLRTRRVVL